MRPGRGACGCCTRRGCRGSGIGPAGASSLRRRGRSRWTRLLRVLAPAADAPDIVVGGLPGADLFLRETLIGLEGRPVAGIRGTTGGLRIGSCRSGRLRASGRRNGGKGDGERRACCLKHSILAKRKTLGCPGARPGPTSRRARYAADAAAWEARSGARGFVRKLGQSGVNPQDGFRRLRLRNRGHGRPARNFGHGKAVTAGCADTAFVASVGKALGVAGLVERLHQWRRSVPLGTLGMILLRRAPGSISAIVRRGHERMGAPLAESHGCRREPLQRDRSHDQPGKHQAQKQHETRVLVPRQRHAPSPAGTGMHRHSVLLQRRCCLQVHDKAMVSVGYRSSNGTTHL